MCLGTIDKPKCSAALEDLAEAMVEGVSCKYPPPSDPVQYLSSWKHPFVHLHVTEALLCVTLFSQTSTHNDLFGYGCCVVHSYGHLSQSAATQERRQDQLERLAALLDHQVLKLACNVQHVSRVLYCRTMEPMWYVTMQPCKVIIETIWHVICILCKVAECC